MTPYKKGTLIAVALVWYVMLATLSTMYFVVKTKRLESENEKIKNELMEIKMCGLDVIVCDDDEQVEEKKTTNASWYDYRLGGVVWSKTHRTTASREFERGTIVEVTNKKNSKSVEVVVNDYGPDESEHPDRELDLSSYAFAQIADLFVDGVVEVEYRVVGKDENYGKR